MQIQIFPLQRAPPRNSDEARAYPPVPSLSKVIASYTTTLRPANPTLRPAKPPPRPPCWVPCGLGRCGLDEE